MANLTLSYANMLSPAVGEHGLDPAALDAALPRLAELTQRLNDTRGTGWERWRDLPLDPLRGEHMRAVAALAEKLRPATENLVVLGIGGSALGNIALQNALNPSTHNLMPAGARSGPRLFVLDNVDPHLVQETLEEVRRSDPRFERTIVNVISKSGETAETAAQFIIARAMLKDALGARHAEHIVAITDPARGTMRAICDAEGYATLPVPDGVGGRFSVLSPVGLFSAAMCGIDIDALLDGAAAMDARCADLDASRNPAAILAWLLIESARNPAAPKPIHVLMPYSNALYSLADWYRQLWAESLGKRFNRTGSEVFAGATPIKALGATDQHSQIQLYREGPNDKVIGLIEVDRFERDVAIPPIIDGEKRGGANSDESSSALSAFSAVSYLAGSTLGTLLNAEKRATEFALIESRRPNYTITFPRITAFHVGEFLQLWMVATAYAGLMLDIDAYDQPAVETGKLATFGLMGRVGYEEWKSRVEAARTSGEALII
jgi:glucose-6-phosphate isomerase